MQQGQTNKATLFAGAITETQNSTPASLGQYKGVIGYLKITASAGTLPTLDIKLQDSPNGTDWYDIPSGSFTQAITTTTQRLVIATQIGGDIRAVATIGGTDTPSFTTSLTLIGTL